MKATQGRYDDAMSVTCPRRDCSRPAARMCVYTTAPTGSGRQIGQEARRPHAERLRLGSIVRDRRREQALLESLASVVLAPVSNAGWEIAADLNEHDRREHNALRAWLARYGPVLWQDPS